MILSKRKCNEIGHSDNLFSRTCTRKLLRSTVKSLSTDSARRFHNETQQRMQRIWRFFALVTTVVCSSHAQLCSLPESSDILGALQAALNASATPLQPSNDSFGSGSFPNETVEQIEILTYNFTCLAVRGAGEYTHASVVIKYMYSFATTDADSAKLMPCDVETSQIQLICTSALGSTAFWQESGEGVDDSLPAEPFAIPTRSDCWKCQEDGMHVDTISNCLRK